MRVTCHLGHFHTLLRRRRLRGDRRRTRVEQRQQLPPHTGGEQQQEGREPAEGAARGDHAGEANSVSVGRGWGGVRRLIRAAKSTINTTAKVIGVEVSSFTSQR